MNRRIIGVTVGTPISPKAMERKLKPVKTVNGIEPDQNGNVNINGGTGEDVFSPVAKVTQTDTGAVISITDKSGTTTATLVNGKDGEKGDKGDPGAQGDKGDKGERGTGILKVTSSPDSYTTTTNGVNPIKRMAISTIKTQSGVSEVLVGDCIAYSYYLYHIYYVNATYAYMDKYQSIRGATGDDGAKGDKGDPGEKGEKGDSGVHILSAGETIADAPDDVDVVIDPNGEADLGSVVQTVNGIAPDENGNVQIEVGGGSSVQSDWNQTDETAADFIKNKPFGDVSTVILEEQELAFDAETGGCMGVALAPIQGGDALSLVVDGESYECNAVLFAPYIVFGNLSLAEMGKDTGEPFLGMYGDSMVMFMFMDELNHTVKITAYLPEKLNNKYITAQAVFYKKTGADDNYLYTDSGCTIKATKMDVVSAARKMPIVVFLSTTYFLSAVTVTAEGDYAEVYYCLPTTDGRLIFAAMVTAEYTPTT